MPFTVSHVAAALPFLPTPLFPAAVVVGTMAPDIPYSVPLFVPRDFSHGPIGAVTIDPAIALGWVRTAGVLLLSLLVGIVTHLLWDSFVHPGSVVDHLGVLRTMLGPLPLDKWLQHASSVGGLVILAIWAARRLRSAASDPTRPSRLSRRTRAIGEGAFVVAGVVSGLAFWFHGIAAGSLAFDPDLVFLVARVGVGVAGSAAALLVVRWYTVGRPPRDRPASAPTLTP